MREKEIEEALERLFNSKDYKIYKQILISYKNALAVKIACGRSLSIEEIKFLQGAYSKLDDIINLDTKRIKKEVEIND